MISSAGGCNITRNSTQHPQFDATASKLHPLQTQPSTLNSPPDLIRNDTIRCRAESVRTVRRPPGLPSACNLSNNKLRASNIVNLDKNRIRQTRPRLLARPLSLPNGFNLMRQFSKLSDVAQVQVTAASLQPAAPPKVNQDAVAPPTVNIALIKQLEDDIYDRKQILQRGTETCRNGGLSGDCPHCRVRMPSDANAFVSIPVSERRSFRDSSATRDSVAIQAIMLLDAWQMEPLLMKYAKTTTELGQETTEADPANAITAPESTRSIIIINNSSFNPTVMKYDIRTQQPLSCATKKPATQKSGTEPTKSHTTSNVFQRCLGGNASDSDADDEHDIPISVSIGGIGADCVTSDRSSAAEMLPTQRKQSKFKRFVLQRRSLNLTSSAAGRSDAAEPTTYASPRPNAVNALQSPSSSSSSPPVASRNDDGRISDDINGSAVRASETSQLNSYQSAGRCLLPTINADTFSSWNGRKWRSDDDIYSTLGGTSGSRLAADNADLLELDRMQHQLNLLSADLADRRRQLQLEQRGILVATAAVEPVKKRSPSMLQLFGHAQKRHSIGSPTDVVKTWVYRRRYFVGGFGYVTGFIENMYFNI